MFDRVVHDEDVDMEPGDILVMYTDGVTEGMNDKNEVFGEKRLIALVERGKDMDAAMLLDMIRAEYKGFVGDMDQFDDMTAVVIKCPFAA